jgi:uncharacterized iron-regulated membrane protein
MRRLIKEAHVLIGFLSALFIFSISLTGIAIAFAGQLMAWETGAFNTPQEKVYTYVKDLNKIVAQVQEYAGDTFIPVGYLGPNAEIKTETEMIYGLSAPMESGGEIQIVTLQHETRMPLGIFTLYETITHEIIDFHYNLLLGDLGETITSIVGIMLGVLAIFGVFLWWPSLTGIKRVVKKILTFDLKGGLFLFNYRLHSILGFWLSVFVLVWGITGTYWTSSDWFPNVVKPQPMLNQSYYDQALRETACDSKITLNDALQESLKRYPAARLFEAEFATDWQPYYVMYLSNGNDTDLHDADIRVWVHAMCEDMVFTSEVNRLGKVGAIAKSLHSGRVFGAFSKVVITLIGLGIIFLSITGVYLSIKHYAKLIKS